jgi:hypothetical protein
MRSICYLKQPIQDLHSKNRNSTWYTLPIKTILIVNQKHHTESQGKDSIIAEHHSHYPSQISVKHSIFYIHQADFSFFFFLQKKILVIHHKRQRMA